MRPELIAYREFVSKHGNESFATLELAQEFVHLKIKWWGSNLICIEIRQEGSVFTPYFNVFD